MFLQKPSFEVWKGNGWRLATPCVYLSREYARKITVPEGFVTDLASIPRVFRRILPVNDSHRLAAVVHDYLYAYKGMFGPSQARLTRKECDKVFLEAMKILKVPKWKRLTMYYAVRAGGRLHW